MTEIPRRRILVVDDEMLIAMLLEQMAQDLGYEVVGPALTIDEAMSFLERESFDCAVLDVSLGHGVSSAPIAEALRAKGIPFLFASGYGSKAAIENPGDEPILSKPFVTHDLAKALQHLLS